MTALINFVSCGVLWLGLGLKLRDLIGHRSDPFLRTITALLALASLCFLFGSPPTVGAVNRISGIPNLAAPLTYAVITAYGASSLVLVVYWRDGTRGRRTARLWIISYAVIVTAIGVLFALGTTPVERRTDFDTYYARTPYISAMIVLYLVAHLIAVSITCLWSLRWAMGRTVHGWVQASLLALAIGTLMGADFSITKLTSVIALWSGNNLNFFSTRLSPGFAGLGAFLTVVAVLLPFLGHHLTRWWHELRLYRQLAPLDRLLKGFLKRRALRLRLPLSPSVWVTWRQTSINNGLAALQDYFNRDLYGQTLERELDATGDRPAAETVALATTIAAAALSENAGRPTPGWTGQPVLLDPHHMELHTLVRISAALAASERVMPLRARGDSAAKSRA
ncbi:MAB_1171c family putative transporter [Streptomyces lasalocidi]